MSDISNFKKIITNINKSEHKSNIIKQNKFPFNTSDIRKDIILNNFPGPGTYDLLETKKKNQFNEFLEPVFISSEKRFKTDIYTSNLPGPGYYDNSDYKKQNKKNIIIPKNKIIFKQNLTSLNKYNINNEDDQLIIGPDSNNNKINTVNQNNKSFRKIHSIDKSLTENINKKESLNYYSKDMSTSTNEDLDLSLYIYHSKKDNTKNNNQVNPKYIINNKKILEVLLKNNKKKEIKKDDIIHNDSNDLYYEPYKYEDLKKYLPKQTKFQNFGSQSPRFPINTLNSNTNINKTIENNYNENNYNNNIKFKPRIPHKIDPIFYEKLIEKKISTLGPGSYDIDNKFHKPISNISNFGSNEIRFKNNKLELNTPGPFISHKSWDIKKESKKRFMPPHIKYKINKTESFKNIKETNSNINEINTISYNLKNPPYKKFTIAPFGTLEERNMEIKAYSKIGPGSYNISNNINNIIDISKKVAFNSANERFSKDIVSELGPGTYRYESYFDWNKKSYNKLLI